MILNNKPILNGILSKDKTKSLIYSLHNISSAGISKLVFEFKKETKSLYINACSDNRLVFARVYYDSCILDGFEIEKDFEFGVSNLQDFVGVLDLFKSQNIDIKMSNEIISISSDENFLDYYGADTKTIKKGKEGTIAHEKLCSIECNDTFESFLNAINKLENNYVILKGNHQNKIITLSVADKDTIGNTFTKKINSDLNKDFKVVIVKEFFKNCVGIPSLIDIYEKFIKTDIKKDLYKIEFYVLAHV